MLKETQRGFWAVNMNPIDVYDPARETEYLAKGDLKDAAYDDTLKHVASTYVRERDRLIPGVGRAGARVVNFAPLLVLEQAPLNTAVRELLAVAKETLGTDVEIEIAVDIDPKEALPMHIGFLQARRLPVLAFRERLSLERLQDTDVVVASENALGNGQHILEDIVYLRPETFEPRHGFAAAQEIEKINRAFVTWGRSYILIGFGRIGTSDPWRGLPGGWSCFSRAQAIVEVEKEGMETTLSQGSHFFHNVTSLGVFYFSVPLRGRYGINWSRIEQFDEISSGQFVRHVRSPVPLLAQIDGKNRRGVIAYNDR